MSERLIFVNGIPSLLNKLKEHGKEGLAVGLVKDFLRSTFEEDIDQKVDRFLEFKSNFLAADMDYFRLYWELRQLYINGMFYSTVVLSGVLCERICYDIISREGIKAGSRILSQDQLACIFEMNLSRMITLLFAWGLIEEDTKKELFSVSEKRNSYVHPKKSSKLDAKKDAAEVIRRISKILTNEFQVKIVKIAKEKSTADKK